MSDDHKLKQTAYHEVGHAVAVLLLGGTVRELHIEPGNGNLGEMDADLTGNRNKAIMILASFVAQRFYEPDYLFNVPDGLPEGFHVDCWMLHGHLKPDDPSNDYGRLKGYLFRIAEEQYRAKTEGLTNEAAEALVAPIFQSVMQEAEQLLAPYKEAIHRAANLLFEKKRLTGEQLQQALNLT